MSLNYYVITVDEDNEPIMLLYDTSENVDKLCTDLSSEYDRICSFEMELTNLEHILKKDA